MIFATSWAFLDIVSLLISSGAVVNAKDAEQDTPLLIAASEGHDDVCALLLRNGADINAVNETGWSSVEAALENSHHSTVRMLLESGHADPTGLLTLEAPRRHRLPGTTVGWPGAAVFTAAEADGRILARAIELAAAEAVEIANERQARVDAAKLSLASAGDNMATSAVPSDSTSDAADPTTPAGVSPASPSDPQPPPVNAPPLPEPTNPPTPHAAVLFTILAYARWRRRRHIVMLKAMMDRGLAQLTDPPASPVEPDDDRSGHFVAAAVFLPRDLFRRVVGYL